MQGIARQGRPAPHAPRLRAKSPPITTRPAATLADLASSGWISPGQAGLWTRLALAAACEQVYGPGTCNAGRLPHSPAYPRGPDLATTLRSLLSAFGARESGRRRARPKLATVTSSCALRAGERTRRRGEKSTLP